MPARRVDSQGVERNRTLADDLELLVRVAGAGGRVELSVDGGRVVALLMPSGGRAYSAKARTLRVAVRRLRDELEQLAAVR